MRVGIGWRPEIAADLLARPGAVDLIEITAESCTTAEGRREARAVAEVWPACVHGVKLSLGSAEGIDPARARRLGDLARELRSPCVSEHVSFVRAKGREIGHLTPVPHTREAVAVIARNVAIARRGLPDVPFLLENIAWAFRWPEDALEEGAFHEAVVRATGCELLLDVANLFANARNAGRDPLELLESYPLDRVGMLHVAGGVQEEGFYFDTHADPVPGEVVALVRRVLAVRPGIPVVLERDAGFPAFGELEQELETLRACAMGAPEARNASERVRLSPAAPLDVTGTLAVEQERVARLLTDAAAPTEDGARPFDVAALVRARGVLERKRADDALPLLPRLARAGDSARRIALACVTTTPRASALVAVADALRIAEAALAEPTLASAARADRLDLRARFSGPDARGELRPRRAPFVGRARLGGGVTRWALKGPGSRAAVRVIEHGGGAP